MNTFDQKADALSSDCVTPERLAGIDFGTKRIGVALADTVTRIASPHCSWTRKNDDADRDFFVQLVASEQIDRFVIGLPIHLDGTESQKSQEARRFGQWLAKATGIPVEFFDERFTTVEADEILNAASLTKKKKQIRRDPLAAQIMLSGYLEAGGGNDGLNKPID